MFSAALVSAFVKSSQPSSSLRKPESTPPMLLFSGFRLKNCRNCQTACAGRLRFGTNSAPILHEVRFSRISGRSEMPVLGWTIPAPLDEESLRLKLCALPRNFGVLRPTRKSRHRLQTQGGSDNICVVTCVVTLPSLPVSLCVGGYRSGTLKRQ